MGEIMKIDKKGQMTVELILLVSFAIVSAMILANAVMDSNELNMAMASARNGAYEGISSNGMAIYPKESFDNYTTDPKKQSMMRQKCIKIVKITETDKGKDNFNRTRIQLKIYAHSQDIKTTDEKPALFASNTE